MQPFRADLHCHSTCSDGSLTPQDLIQEAIAAGLQGLSITDHDTIAAFALATSSAQQNHLALIPGVEFSAMLDGTSVHLLGYAFSLSSPAILELCKRHEIRREERNNEILEKLSRLGLPLTMEEVRSAVPATVGRPHIALAMVQKGYVPNIQDAFKRFIGDGRPAFARGRPISVEETIAVIHEAKGMAIIAHPHLIQDPAILKKILEMPFDGIECYYARFSLESNAPWIELASKRGWLMTGGSDFHGAVKPTIPLGASWVAEETFQRLQDNHLKNNVF
ncbi:MAG: PHP domain-containing protein [Parachlamydia sp.]|nr:PHP domain-containing protein [Parachlamydia sp.]